MDFDPSELHESAVAFLAGFILFAAAINGIYVFMLGRFYKELEQLDPQVWESIGSPRLGQQIQGQASTRSFWAFLGPLRDKAGHPKYPAAYWAWFWFRVAAASTSLIFVLATGVIGLIIFYDL